MADDLKSLAARVQKLETRITSLSNSVQELERKGKYLDGVLDAQNKMQDRMASVESRLENVSKRVGALQSK